MQDTETQSASSENNDEESAADRDKQFCYSLYSYKSALSLVKSNLPAGLQDKLQELLTTKLQKGSMYSGQGNVITLNLSSSETKDNWICYYCFLGSNDGTNKQESDSVASLLPVEDAASYLICFASHQEEGLDLFRGDLDHYCSEVFQQLQTEVVQAGADISTSLTTSLESWHTAAVDYLVRCKQAVQDNMKYLIYSALLDNKLVLSGGTNELQTDIQKFYNGCSLSGILSQLREARLQQEIGSMAGSVDMLTDMEAHNTLTVSISADSIKLDLNGCNKFCEEWANTLNRMDVLDNPTKLKQVNEAYKLKFIQTMNNLKRLLRQAENDFYALHRSYVFLRNSGNSEILLHYVTAEATGDTADILGVLQDFIQEQQS